MKSMLDKQYEHFGKLNDHLLGMWAGPEHWRRKAKRPRLEGGALKSNEEHAQDGDVVETCVKTIGNRKGSKSKKDKGQKICYEDALKPGENRTKSGKLCRRDWLNSILPSGVENSAASNATVFKESYRLKASRQMNMIPSEISDTRQSLYQIVNREVLLRSNTQPGGRNTINGAHNNNENGDNVNGIDNLIVGVPDGSFDNGNMYGDDMDDGLHHPLADHDDDDDALPFEGAFTQNTGYNDYALDDMELISQPNKVARIEIGYARTAKMINVQRLKSAMWQFLEHSVPRVNSDIQSLSPSVASTVSAPDAGSFTEDATSAVNAAEDKEKLMDDCITGSDEANASRLPKVPGAKSFSEVIDSLSGRISWQMAKELSISIALNCLLHMSNEKQLYLENVDNFSNIFISQGLPSFELKLLESYTQPDDDSSPDTPSDRTIPNSTNNNNKNNKHKRNKAAQRVRMSTLDSWLGGSDGNE
ncbi:unnamed protein product [Trichobilharzia regenti]|nr:unnamed protein product [Trichobilharzia regenti]